MGTILVGVLLAAMVGAAVRSMIKNKKKGGCAGCSGCAGNAAGACGQKTQ